MHHWKRSFPGLILFVVLVFGLVLQAHGELMLFDDELTFSEAIEGIDLELDEFSDLIEGYYAEPIRRWVNDPSEYSL